MKTTNNKKPFTWTPEILARRCRQLGYTVRTSLNPDYVRDIDILAKVWGKKVAEAVQVNDAKKAVQGITVGGEQKRCMRHRLENPDRFVYNKDGEAIYWYEGATQKVLKLENN